jgi:preprotein translocase subunit SecE
VQKNKRFMAKIGTYIQESADELLNKVSWPTWPELQNSSVIVLLASVIFALIIFVMDQSFSELMKFVYSLFE